MLRSAVVAFLAVAAAVAFARCGPEAITNGNIAPPPDGGFTVSPADGGTADGGEPDGGTPDAGGGGNDGGPSANECDGIAPAGAEQAVTIQVPHSPGEACWDVTADLQSNVAADVANGPWSTFSSTGAQLGSGIPAGSLWPVAQGFQGVRSSGVPTLFYWAPNASVANATPVGTASSNAQAYGAYSGVAPNGVVVVTQDCGGGSGGMTLARFDGQGRLAASARYPEAGCGPLAAVGDALGNTLVIAWPGNVPGFAGDEFAARWFGAQQTPLTGWFSAGRGASSRSAVLLRPLAAGGAALQVDGNWTQTFRSGIASADAAFPWLSAQNDFIAVRQGRAYAFFPRDSGPRDVLRLVAPSGNTCAAIRFSAGALSVAPDGTVIGSQGEGGCTHQFWPGLLR